MIVRANRIALFRVLGRCEPRRRFSVQSKLKSTISKKKVVSAGLLESWTKGGVLRSASGLGEAEPTERDVDPELNLSPAPLDKKPGARRRKNPQRELQEQLLSGDPPAQFISVATKLRSLYHDYSESRDLVDQYLAETPLPRSEDINYEQQQGM